MSLARSVKQYLGVRALRPPDLQPANRDPTSADKAYVPGTLWLNKVTPATFMWSGTAWVSLGSGTVGGINTLTGSSGGAITPVSSNISLLGTTNQINTVGTPGTITWSIPTNFQAPGSVTAATTLIATSGSVQAVAGDLVASQSGTGIVLNPPTGTGTAAAGITLNSRCGTLTFTAVSIAAGADLTLSVSNDQVVTSSTQFIYSWSGATTSSALCMKSAATGTNSMTFILTNGTGATTSTADIVISFLLLN